MTLIASEPKILDKDRRTPVLDCGSFKNIPKVLANLDYGSFEGNYAKESNQEELFEIVRVHHILSDLI